MKIVVFSCAKYSDAWLPFFYFFRKFWPNCPYPVHLVSDIGEDQIQVSPIVDDIVLDRVKLYPDVMSWNNIVFDFCHNNMDEPILMLLEDYWLTAPVSNLAIERAFALMGRVTPTAPETGCVRLYPCPGGDEEVGNPEYALVSKGAPYRISTQAAIWHPGYLREIAGATKTPWSFELDGTKISNQYIAPIYAFKRDVQPWPIEYICTAIVQGVWQANAYRYCKFHGIAGQVDWTRRPMQVQE